MSRIRQILVPAYFPKAGPATVMIYGEAPGPRGADQSGIPFWGDAAGIAVYRALLKSGRAKVPEAAFSHWDGQILSSLSLAPELVDTVLSNAYPHCPTRDGEHFHAPTDKQLLHPNNLERIVNEIRKCRARDPVKVIVLGKRAHWLFERLIEAPPFVLVGLPHPSAQGLLQAAPGKGKGLKLHDLRTEWERTLGTHLGPGSRSVS
jgi:hypothetical protein